MTPASQPRGGPQVLLTGGHFPSVLSWSSHVLPLGFEESGAPMHFFNVVSADFIPSLREILALPVLMRERHLKRRGH